MTAQFIALYGGSLNRLHMMIWPLVALDGTSVLGACVLVSIKPLVLFVCVSEFIGTTTSPIVYSSSKDAPSITSLSQREAMEFQSKHRICTKNEMQWEQIIGKQEQGGRACGQLYEVI